LIFTLPFLLFAFILCLALSLGLLFLARILQIVAGQVILIQLLFPGEIFVNGTEPGPICCLVVQPYTFVLVIPVVGCAFAGIYGGTAASHTGKKIGQSTHDAATNAHAVFRFGWVNGLHVFFVIHFDITVVSIHLGN